MKIFIIFLLLTILSIFLLWRSKKQKATNKPFGLLKVSRKFHKWLMLFIGLQFVIWSITGAYMVIFDIDYIHGDTLVRNPQNTISSDNIHFTLANLYQKYPQASKIEVGKLIEQNVYRFTFNDNKYLLSAETGEQLSPLSKELALKVSKYHYSADDNVSEVELITENPPFELRASLLPAWRVNFDALGSPSIYISAETGKLIGKRHDFWRLFDWMFRFHVMDYTEEEDVHNYLLFFIASFGLAACLSGLVLVYFRVFKKDATEEFV
ncbi:MAG: Cu(I)/Ag(I) efflux system membrane protein CusA/SilA [Enterobacterales bacterium]|jgi:Cu(I)/Ag(I) efflux system membrane protein CusA/SilA